MPSLSVPDVNAMSLIQYFQYSNDPLVKEITKSMIDAGIVVQDIPMMTKKTLEDHGRRIVGGMPGASWQPLNSLPTVAVTPAEEFAESKYQILQSIQGDRLLIQADNQIGDGWFDSQSKSQIEGIAFDVNTYFFNGSHNPADTYYNPNALAGLRYRLDNTAKFGNNPQCKIDAGGVDISIGGVSSTSANTLMTILQRGLNDMGTPDGTGVIIYMNEQTLYLLEQGIRYMGPASGWSDDKDNYDRKVLKYRNAMIRDAGRQKPLADGTQNTLVISNTENANGTDTGNGLFTSIYMVKMGKNDFCMTQFAPLVPIGPERITGTTIYTMILQWALGMWNPNTRAIVRIFDVKTGTPAI